MRGRLEAVVPRYPDLAEVGRAIVITNSERNSAACPLRHWYRHVLGLALPARSITAAGWGTGFHAVMDDLFSEARRLDDVPPYEVVTDSVERVIDGWSDLVSEQYPTEALASDARRLREVVEAWWRAFPLQQFLHDFEVVDVERAYHTPIVNPASGTPVRASMRVVEIETESGRALRLARPGDENSRRVQWPWVFAGRVDLTLASRSTGALWLADHKTTARPTGLASSLVVDPQSTSYAWLVEQMTGRPVAGFIWNIVDSARPGDPRILKSGKLSTAKNQKVPSWKLRSLFEERFEKTGVAASEAELDFMEQQRQTIDSRWSQMEQIGIRRNDIQVAGIEIHADALRLAMLYRTGLVDDRIALAATHPRVPVCRSAGAFCDFKGPCAADGELARMGYEDRPSRSWRKPPHSRSSPGSTPSAEETSATTNTNGDLGW